MKTFKLVNFQKLRLNHFMLIKDMKLTNLLNMKMLRLKERHFRN